MRRTQLLLEMAACVATLIMLAMALTDWLF
jgi:hypothetical protein